MSLFITIYLFLFYVKREFIEGFEGVARGFREVYPSEGPRNPLGSMNKYSGEIRLNKC